MWLWGVRKINILWVLTGGPSALELRRALPGVTQHMLTAQLRALEADGLVARTPYAEIPPWVDLCSPRTPFPPSLFCLLLCNRRKA
ncbi:winged helix-turn-helix transcriptional regulator [Sinorhizobium medicae]|uniref:winged helix-turn-helix transcriptional regulator n=1 Tax=Sinorhizobium medicae TaxID=110321 RepID=UPI00396A6FE7